MNMSADDTWYDPGERWLWLEKTEAGWGVRSASECYHFI